MHITFNSKSNPARSVVTFSFNNGVSDTLIDLTLDTQDTMR